MKLGGGEKRNKQATDWEKHSQLIQMTNDLNSKYINNF